MTTKKHFFKNIVVTFMFLVAITPIYTYAYSDEVIIGGENVGIELNMKGVMVIGLYKVDNTYPGKDAKMQVGDIILKVNEKNISNISEMVAKIEEIEDKSNIKITYLRETKENLTNLKLVKQSDGVYKTGLYVKDKINGIGTLTFIDPTTKFFGALGHEIIESNSMKKLEIKDGKIYKSEVTDIEKSSRGTPGEKNAKYFKEEIYGNIKENTSSGIFGKYSGEIEGKEKVKVSNKNEVELGKATIRTVLSGSKVEEFEINITKIDLNETNTKNILFEITDQKLLDQTGGVVQGMSGSPIIQNNKIIGAVTHVVIDNPNKGYGIFITTMLEESEN